MAGQNATPSEPENSSAVGRAMTEGRISLRVVSNEEIPVWVRLAAPRSLAEPGAGIDDEAECLERFAQAPEQWRQISYLAWRGSRAVARLRLSVHGAIGEIWGLDLAPEVRAEGLEAALIEALRQKRIAGAGLDVFEKEPMDLTNPLLQMEHVVCTPHIGGAALENSPRRRNQAWENFEDVLNGLVPASLISPGK